MEYPIEVVGKARRLWLELTSAGKQRSFEDVAKAINAEFNTRIPRKTIHKWSQDFGWTRPEDKIATETKTPVRLPVVVTNDDDLPPMDWDWEREKVKFLAELTGIAHDSLAAIRSEEGKPDLLFRDAESAAKTGLACLEAVGKINSGKYDRAEDGDRLPALNESDVQAIVMFFATKGKSPRPDIRGTDPVIDLEVIHADSDRKNERSHETRRISPPDPERDSD